MLEILKLWNIEWLSPRKLILLLKIAHNRILIIAHIRILKIAHIRILKIAHIRILIIAHIRILIVAHIRNIKNCTYQNIKNCTYQNIENCTYQNIKNLHTPRKHDFLSMENKQCKFINLFTSKVLTTCFWLYSLEEINFEVTFGIRKLSKQIIPFCRLYSIRYTVQPCHVPLMTCGGVGTDETYEQ